MPYNEYREQTLLDIDISIFCRLDATDVKLSWSVGLTLLLVSVISLL